MEELVRLETIIHYTDLSLIRKKHPDKVIIFCSGAFDVVHGGHILFLEDCKKQGDVLVVEVAHDALIKKHKGELRPVFNEHIRMKIVSSLKPVDYCFLDIPVEGYPLSFLGTVFKMLRPDKYVINSDAFDIPYREQLVKEYTIELIILPRWAPPEFEQMSTTKIVEKIRSKVHKE